MNVGGPDGEIVFRHDKGEVDDETEGARFAICPVCAFPRQSTPQLG